MAHLLATRFRSLRLARGLLALWAVTAMGLAAAQAGSAARAPDARTGAEGRQERTVGEWLKRMHEAARQRSYIGTFVVSSSSGAMSSARIWHACDGERQVERIESLTGTPRSTFRRDDEVLIFEPESRTVRRERRESLGMFPEMLDPAASSIPEFYTARHLGRERVAGYEADVVQLVPRDQLRFGYRFWSERDSGLVLKLQTLDAAGRVLEQAAFSELQLDAPVRMASLRRMMVVPPGWRVEQPEAVRTTAAAEGWGLRAEVPGFQAMGSYKRPAEGVLQWIFSDGLASVSVFVEAYDQERHRKEGLFASGATHTLARRMGDSWVTAVGEVPPQALVALAGSLEPRKPAPGSGR